MTLQIKNFTKKRINQKYLNRVMEETLKVAKIKMPVEISLVITGEKRIKSLNKKYRNIDKVTDVLSFGNEDLSGVEKFIIPPEDIVQFGEIFICYPKIVKQAKGKKHSIKKEFSILLIHGILHLSGLNHVEDYENSVMKVLEIKILKKI